MQQHTHQSRYANDQTLHTCSCISSCDIFTETCPGSSCLGDERPAWGHFIWSIHDWLAWEEVIPKVCPTRMLTVQGDVAGSSDTPLELVRCILCGSSAFDFLANLQPYSDRSRKYAMQCKIYIARILKPRTSRNNRKRVRDSHIAQRHLWLTLVTLIS